MPDRMPVSTSARQHDVTSPKRRSADTRITDVKVSCDCQHHECGKKNAPVTTNVLLIATKKLDPSMPIATRESTRALPDVVTAIGRTALRRGTVLHRNRTAPRVKNNYVSRQAVASPDCVAVLAYQDLTTARDTDTGLRTDLRHLR